MEIIRNYAATLEKIFPMDAPLCAGLQGFILVNAAENNALYLCGRA